MASLQHIRRRTDSVKNTQKVTNAMKMVSASKLRRAQEAAEKARPYASKMNDMFAGLSIDPEQATHPLLVAREAKKAVVVIVTPDRGLCGGLNTNLCKLAYAQVNDLAAQGLDPSVIAVGKKGREFFKRRGVAIDRDWEGLLGSVTYASAKEIGGMLVSGYLASEFDKVVLVFAHFKSVISQVVDARQILPIAVEGEGGGAGTPSADVSFLFEPSDEEVLDALLPKYIEVQLYQAMLESAASEHGARMTAMDAATRNAGEVIAKLTLLYNKTRQEQVTKELLDIIGGVEALNA